MWLINKAWCDYSSRLAFHENWRWWPDKLCWSGSQTSLLANPFISPSSHHIPFTMDSWHPILVYWLGTGTTGPISLILLYLVVVFRLSQSDFRTRQQSYRLLPAEIVCVANINHHLHFSWKGNSPKIISLGDDDPHAGQIANSHRLLTEAKVPLKLNEYRIHKPLHPIIAAQMSSRSVLDMRSTLFSNATYQSSIIPRPLLQIQNMQCFWMAKWSCLICWGFRTFTR